MEKRKIIIDCDPGVDDALALAYAGANAEMFEVLAVTTVGGNQPIETVTKNALELLDFYGMKIPVAKGMEGPMVRKAVYSPEVYGTNGLGGCELPCTQMTVVSEQAVLYLHQRIMELSQGEKVTLVLTGPMTNVAFLLKLFPEVKERIQEIVFMGGGACEGNVTAAAEFNVYVDPEAAKIVVQSGIPLVMCGLDVTLKCFLDRHQILKLCQSGNKVAKLCGDMAGATLENSAEKYRGVVSIHDVVPLMYLVHPEIFTPRRTILDVDCSEGASRGATLCDFRWWEHEEEAMDSLVLMDVDGKKFQEYLITALYELGETL